MGIIDDVSKGAKTCADKVMTKADAAAKISKLKFDENKLEHKISKELKLLGAKVYKSCLSGDAFDPEEDVLQIREYYENLKSIRAEINKLKESQFSFSKKSAREE